MSIASNDRQQLINLLNIITLFLWNREWDEAKKILFPSFPFFLFIKRATFNREQLFDKMAALFDGVKSAAKKVYIDNLFGPVLEPRVFRGWKVEKSKSSNFPIRISAPATVALISQNTRVVGFSSITANKRSSLTWRHKRIPTSVTTPQGSATRGAGWNSEIEPTKRVTPDIKKKMADCLEGGWNELLHSRKR